MVWVDKNEIRKRQGGREHLYTLFRYMFGPIEGYTKIFGHHAGGPPHEFEVWT